MNPQSKAIYKTMEVKKQSIQELLNDNEKFLEWLLEFYGEDAVGVFTNHLRIELSFVPVSGTKIEFPLISLGQGTINFYPYTTSVKYGRPKDPINLIFHRRGAAIDVNNILLNNVNPVWWDVRTMSANQYTFIDDTMHGGSPSWEKMSFALSNIRGLQSLLHRKHMRIFGSRTGCNHPLGFGQYSLASVHEDDWYSHFLSPVDFDNSQLYVEKLLVYLNKTLSHVVLQPRGETINRVRHDGEATAIEI